MEILIILFLIILAFIEGTLTSVPLVLAFLITLAAYTKSSSVYVYAFFVGCILDILTGRILGVTSLFYVLCLGLIFLYQRKYEINSPLFILFASLTMSLVFGLVFHVAHLFMHVVSSVLFAEAIFFVWKIVFTKKNIPTFSKIV